MSSNETSPPGGSGDRGRTAARLLVFAVLVLAAAPPLVLVLGSLGSISERHWQDILYRPFHDALWRTLRQMSLSALIAFLIGWPYGTALGLFRFPLKRVCWFLLAIPLLMPPFLWAIGIQSLQAYLSYRYQRWVDGYSGCVLAFATQLVPLVALAAALAAGRIKRSELETAILHGGSESAFRRALHHGLPAAMGATLLGSILTLSDSGCGQIMGYHGASGEILVAFSAKSDFGLAALKAVVTLIVFMPLLALAVWLLNRGLFRGGIDRGPGHAGIVMAPARRWLTAPFMILAGACLLLPAVIGLVSPLLKPPRKSYLTDALEIFRESLPVTLHYALVSGILATALAFVAVLACRRGGLSLLRVLLVAVFLFALPSSLNALGILRLGTLAPPAFDFILRSEWIVGIAKGLHLLPLAFVLIVAFWYRLPLSFSDAARLHGVGFARFACCVVAPVLAAPLAGTVVMTGMLALADVTATILLQPPGASSYGTRLYAVMDNSAEKVVASLCLVYTLLPLGLLLLSLPLFSRRPLDD